MWGIENMEEPSPMWNVEDMEVGDYIVIQIRSKHGDRYLDGCTISGKIKELVPSHDMVVLESGWGCHTTDKLLKHKRGDRDIMMEKRIKRMKDRGDI